MLADAQAERGRLEEAKLAAEQRAADLASKLSAAMSSLETAKVGLQGKAWAQGVLFLAQ